MMMMITVMVMVMKMMVKHITSIRWHHLKSKYGGLKMMMMMMIVMMKRTVKRTMIRLVVPR